MPREISRSAIGLNDQLPFDGVDIWNAYEVSFLNHKGKPVVGILECRVPIQSANLIESKSFKLYLNSFNQTKFESIDQVLAIMQKDLSNCAGSQVSLLFTQAHEFKDMEIGDLDNQVTSTNTDDAKFTWHLLDDLDIAIDEYDIKPETLTCEEIEVSETLVSHLLKSNCLITNQPDWGSVLIRYSGKRINHMSLLKYIISFRQHNEFHEQCVERIFNDVLNYCKPTQLTIYARYTRRGGLDINPFRTNFEQPYKNIRLARQ